MSQDERLCVKSLAQVNLDLTTTILIDSSLQSATVNLTNCVWIPQYTQDDNYLKPLGDYLKTFTFGDVRDKIRRDFDMDHLFTQSR